ncbi:MAG: bifunctional 4-hydroxy-2-oxoglutarate aldolase/2-dehydro-3-deoxy-phosphogluconate aldolase [Acidobacteria bacterium ACB1]|nr:bifunctional 4-hydroxy-2-oxoglutarate aldolase/2-dehydro-3-deoxy-phosphogluconate aldolase [Acidobacteria bacterium ACB1]
MTKDDVISRISRTGILPVIRAASSDEARRAIDAICAGGIDTIEVTLTIPNAVTLIETLTQELPAVLFGAGTVLTADDAKGCIDAGAKFIISPATDRDMIRTCNENETVVMPGALTPTEIVGAIAAGADVVKVFPVGALGGVNYIRSLLAPLPDLKLVPTGGITIDTAASFIKAGCLAVGLGSDLVDLAAIREGRAHEVTATARRVLNSIAEARADA